MIPTLVTIGCSITQDYYQKTWANFLSESLGHNLLNIGARGAGMDFLSKRAMLELSDRDHGQTLVAIMLPSSDRFDFYVDSNHPLQRNFLEISSWQDGNQPLLVRLDGSTSKTHGYCLTGGQPRGFKESHYKLYHNNTQSTLNHWFHFIGLQNYLKLKNFRYFFTSVYDLNDTVEQPCNKITDFEEHIDWDKLVDFDLFAGYQGTKGFLSFVRDQGYNIIKNHPVEHAHKTFVSDVILPFIKTIKIT